MTPATTSYAVKEALPFAAAVIKLRRSAVAAPAFRGAALEAQTTTEHEWLLSGPAETGKTFAALYRLDTELRRTPKATAVMVRKVRADMTGSVLQTWRRVIALRGGVEVYGGEEAKFYSYPNGARVYVAGLDRPGAALSSERDFIYVNQMEEIELDGYEYLTTRVTGRGAMTKTPMLFGDCNPGPPAHWITKRPSLKLLHSVHRDNPSLYTDAGALTDQGTRTMAVLDALTGVRRERLYLGKWVAAEGTVYAFDRKLHLVPRFDIPASWRRVRAIDFGFTNPFVCQWWAIDPDGRAFLYREIYRTGKLVEDLAREIKLLTGDEKIETTVADHDAEDRATLARHGIPTVAAFKAVSVGIQAVQQRLAVAGDGKPRLFVLEGALVDRDEALAAAKRPVCTHEEFEVYCWPKGADGKSLKEEPVKLNDHGMDAARYFVAYADALSNAKSEGWLGKIRAAREAKERAA